MIHCPKFQLGYADLPPAFFSEKFDIANGSVKKTVAESRRNRYTASHGKPERVEGFGEEVPHGAL